MRKRYTIFCVMVMLTACQEKTFTNHVDDYFSSQFSATEPGGAILIMKGDSVAFSKGYGVADINTKEKITSRTLFNTGSISKTFVACAILQLAAENKLSLNDSLSKYFSDFKNPSIANIVKIHHLLTHTSGLPDNRRSIVDSVFLLTAKDEENFAPVMQNDSLLFEPGSQFEYSNPAFNGLALIIEKVAGEKWQHVVTEKILQPSGMSTTVITDGSFPESGVSHAYLKTKTGFIEKDYGEEPTFAAAGNGGVWSSTEELAMYEYAIRSALFLNPEWVKKSRTVQRYPNWNSSSPSKIGYSWFIGKTGDGLEMISHTGTQGGFYADFVSIPEKGITYIMLCNIPTQQEEKRKIVLDLLKKFNWLD